MTDSDVEPVVVVGVDGSPSSEEALRWAASYTAAIGGRLRIVTAWCWPHMYGLTMAVDGWDPQGDAQQVAEKASAAVSLPPDRIEIRAGEGRAAAVILAACSGAELLVVGSHGFHPVDRVLLGSVSNECLHDARIPVVLVKTAQDQKRT